MNSQELKDLLDYIQKNNSWEHMAEAFDRDRYVFKYIDICYDTREGTSTKSYPVWSITLRQSRNECITFQEDELKDIISEFGTLQKDGDTIETENGNISLKEIVFINK